MYVVRHSWGNIAKLEKNTINKKLKSHKINPIKLIKSNGSFHLPEEIDDFKEASIVGRKKWLNASNHEVKLITCLFSCYLFYILFFEFDIEKVKYIVTFLIILCGVPFYLNFINKQALVRLQNNDMQFIKTFREITEIESRTAYLPLTLSPIIIYFSIYVNLNEYNNLPKYLNALLTHNSLLHWSLNFFGLLWCVKLIEGRYSFLYALFLLFMSLTINFYIYHYIHLDHGLGLSSIIYTLLPFILFINFEVGCKIRLKEYISAFVMLTIASTLVLDYIDTKSHLLGFVAGSLLTALLVLLAKKTN